MKKVIRYVEAMWEGGDDTEPEVSEPEAHLDEDSADAVAGEITAFFQKSGTTPSEEESSKLATIIVERLRAFHLEASGGEIESEMLEPLRPLGDGGAALSLTMTRAGFISFTEVAIVKLADLKALIAERDDLFAQAEAFRLGNLKAVLAERDEMLRRADTAAAVPA